MEITINITSITILQRDGHTDHVSLQTTLPGGTFNVKDETLELRVSRGLGKLYVERNFPGVPYEIINGSSPRKKFSAQPAIDRVQAQRRVERMDAIQRSHNPPTCNVDQCKLCDEYYGLVKQTHEDIG